MSTPDATAPDLAPAVVVGSDGLSRCAWCVTHKDYRDYHDHEWGRPVRGDAALFERITLEAFQSGLSWLTILRKRDNLRQAFGDFAIATVARYAERDVQRLMADAGIVRNERKIRATVVNAKAAAALIDRDGEGALDRLVWAHAPDPLGRERPLRGDDLVAHTAESTALSKALKREGFVFVGPTTMHAAMQACGLVDDHVADCWRAT